MLRYITIVSYSSCRYPLCCSPMLQGQDPPVSVDELRFNLEGPTEKPTVNPTSNYL
jgi:hypothetical protein